ncbi:MAG: hypothetical protein K0R03_2593 [Moraxellaceae bacterium]|jgi:hypothetical protein|nr:hypothetical protein [Moraxellaceae bacterium]
MQPERRLSRFHRLLCLCLLALPGLVQAAGTFVPAPQRADMVYDDRRDLLYISNGSQLLRYQLASGTFIDPLELGGSLKGMDISPDGSTLAVADTSYDSGSNSNWVHLVDLGSMATRKVSFTRTPSESGTFTVAWAGDGSLLVTSTFLGSGWVPLRRYVPATGQVATLASVRQDTMLRASADGSVVGFAESNISDGRFGRYRVSDGHLLFRQGYSDGTGWFNYEIAASRNGSQYALPTYGGTFITDAGLVKQPAPIGQYAGPQPVGVAYHPTRDLVYFPWAGTNTVQVYDSTTLTRVTEYDFENAFTSNGNRAFVNGRLRLSRNGSLLFASVDGGVCFLRLPDAPPVADAKSVLVPEDQPRTIALSGSDPEGLPLTYHLVSPPQHGTLAGSASAPVYTPAANYNGSDGFSYLVRDGGQSSAPAQVTIAVTAVNDAPTFRYADASPLVVARNRSVSLAGAFTGISAGPADEAGQQVSFAVSNSNPALFSVQPAVSATGTLTLKAVKKGTATLRVIARDNGGTANGGVEASAPFDLVITVK